MEFRNLTSFVRAAELHSFSQAAKQLGYSQSAISMQIGQLENELGTPLFDRVGKSVALTPEGLRFYEYAQNILRMVENARNVMTHSSLVSGHLRVAMAASLSTSLFPDVIRKYRAKYPDVDITIHTGTTSDLFGALAQNDADILYHLDNRVYRSDLAVALAEPVPIIFVAPADHPLAGKENLSVKDCLPYPFILTEKGMSYRAQLDHQLAERDMEIKPFLEIGNTDVIMRLVESGLGISFLPEFVAHSRIEAGTAVRLDIKDVSVELWRQLIYYRNKWMTPAMRALIDLICEEEQH